MAQPQRQVARLPLTAFGNPIGKRTGMCDAAGSEAWSYDITPQVGWKITDARTTSSVTKNAVSQKNLGGLLYTLTYPSGRTIIYTLAAWGTEALPQAASPL